METGSSSESTNKAPKTNDGKKLGSMLPNLDPFVPKKDHNPRELRSWAKRTGFVSASSGAMGISAREKNENSTGVDLKQGLERRVGSSPKIEIDPVLGRTRPNRGIEIEPASRTGNGGTANETEVGVGLINGAVRVENQRKRSTVDPPREANEDVKETELNRRGKQSIQAERSNGNGSKASAISPQEPKSDDNVESDQEMDEHPSVEEAARSWWHRSSGLKFRLSENPSFAPLVYYSLQHYLSIAGSLIFVPSIIVPTMGGSDKDIATVISTLLLVSGISTILHSYFGTRLPLVQGNSFVYLAPVLVIANAQEYRNLSEHKFRRIMRELQGAVIVGSVFQSILGFSGLMSLLVRFINPVVVAPTVAAVGLAFFSYGFAQAGTCVEISIPLILLVLLFTLYLRGVSISGHRIFCIYAVPLSVVLTWIYASFLTAGGVYDYKGCSTEVPSSNILVDACRKHAYTMKHCRTDVSNALRTSSWVRIPYPLQWGIPIFSMRTSIIMIITSVVASVDSVGTYHSTSLRINVKPPTPHIVSRGIALEGFCSILSGLWGTGTGATTLTENIHTIDVAKVASRRVVTVGAVFLIFFSFVEKVGALLASIPLAMVASILCFIWALIVALGLSTLQYTQTASFRNIIIVGVALFLGLSIPTYFQRYQPELALILPSYFLPYASASIGPVNSGSKSFDFALNAIMSMNMVVTLLIAFILDNTVPGNRQERGVYIWSRAEDIKNDPTSFAEYSLPRKFPRWKNHSGLGLGL